MNIGDKVKIIPLAVEGRVIAELRDRGGELIKVRYFWNGDAKEVFFFKDEIEATQAERQCGPTGFTKP